MNAAQFIAKWRKVALTERSASQQHFLDLCEVFDHPKPAEADPQGSTFTFEKGVQKRGGKDGWADVWKRGFFGWEYKRKHKDLDAAYDQLLQYREDLENPPLLVASDMGRIVIHTNFTGTPTDIYDIPLEEMGRPDKLETLRRVFHEPYRLKPGITDEAVTGEAARHIAEIAQRLRDRGLEPHDVARFLDRIVFCLFAEDIGLLPEKLFSRMVEKTRDDASRFTKLIGQLFEAMARGGDFGLDTIRHFDGNLFREGPVLDVTLDEIHSIHEAAKLDWTSVDPSIFGTLFERGLDPDKRSQLGAHYTSRDDIVTLVEPVVMAPLRREWAETRSLIDNLLTTGKKKPTGRERKAPTGTRLRKARDEGVVLINRFLGRLARIKVLDPACGSGNFLYVTLQMLKDLEKEVITYGMDNDLGGFLPWVNPTQLYGIEINPYAFELAQMTVWIGYLQWTRRNGFGWPREPLLKPMDNFECKDAILDLSDPDHPKEPAWPKVDFIVGNPPFLGSRFMRAELGDHYVLSLVKLYQTRLGGRPDLCCYWFETARAHMVQGKAQRVGLLATQGIRGGTNRNVLKSIERTGGLFFAESDRAWVLEGASVHVSMVGFDDGNEKVKLLDGKGVTRINTDLTGGPDATSALTLPENQSISFQGPVKRGAFDVGEERGLELLLAGGNPHGRPNSDVIVPYVNASDLAGRPRSVWIIDFGEATPMAAAAQYAEPFDHLRVHVRPERQKARQKKARDDWWLHWRTRPAMKAVLAPMPRFIATPRVSKHRLFVWLRPPSYPDCALTVFAFPEDYSFGVLHSRIHEVWARVQGTQLREAQSGFRYTPTTCFETFPFPEPTEEQEAAIAEAARELNELRERWLNPPEWTRTEILEFPGSADGPWAPYVHDPDDRGVGIVRYPRTVPKDPECAKKLKKRTLTNLYNERPTWLDLAHKKLDEAVFAAYGWDLAMSEERILEDLLALNLEREQAETKV